jgi:hypothetical protein
VLISDPQAIIALGEQVRPTLESMGISGPVQVVPLPGGANNRVYRLAHRDGNLVVKSYFQHPGDARDRMGAERALYDLISAQGIPCAPASLGWIPQHRLGLFELLPGRKLMPEEVNFGMVQQALAFLSQLNAARQSPAAARIPIASEACFSVAEHLATVDRRVARLQTIEPISTVDHEAIAFVNQELRPAWQQIRTSIESQAAGPTTTDLPRSNWCLSPSDFGFHNAMLAPSGQLRFFDFEYAGWDDPAKLACDFFCQPQLPVPMAEWDLFIATLAHSLKSGDNFPERARFLLDAYRVKWCCIMLNDFLPPSRARREFAGLEDRTAHQLAKARSALQMVS